MAKDSNKKQKSNKSSKKTNKNSFRWLLWLIVAGLVAISFHYLDGYNSPGLINNKSQADTDFREKTKKIHKIVDQVLSEYKDNNLAVKDYDKGLKKPPASTWTLFLLATKQHPNYEIVFK